MLPNKQLKNMKTDIIQQKKKINAFGYTMLITCGECIAFVCGIVNKINQTEPVILGKRNRAII